MTTKMSWTPAQKLGQINKAAKATRNTSAGTFYLLWELAEAVSWYSVMVYFIAAWNHILLQTTILNLMSLRRKCPDVNAWHGPEKTWDASSVSALLFACIALTFGTRRQLLLVITWELNRSFLWLPFENLNRKHWWGTGTGLLERWWMSRPWRHSRPAWTGLQAT